MSKKAEKEQGLKQLHERLIEMIDANEELTKEQTNKAIAEIKQRVANKDLNFVVDSPNYDLRALFNFTTSPLGQDFWEKINFIITKTNKA